MNLKFSSPLPRQFLKQAAIKAMALLFHGITNRWQHRTRLHQLAASHWLLLTAVSFFSYLTWAIESWGFFLSPVSRISFSATSNHSQQINHAAGTWKEQPGNSKQKTKQNCPSNLQGHQDLRQLTVGKPSWRPALCRRAW